MVTITSPIDAQSPQIQQTTTRTSQPTSVNTSRRPSQVNGTTASYSPFITNSDNTSIPIRHPRPMTPAELHSVLEREQEAVVNRLTRELTALRAKNNASVASNHSVVSTTSTAQSLLTIDAHDLSSTNQMTGPTHPTPSRRHRSSSSLSVTSARGIPTSSSSVAQSSSVPYSIQSQASADRTIAATGINSPRYSSTNASGTSTPPSQGLFPNHIPSTSTVRPPIPDRIPSSGQGSTLAILGSTTSNPAIVPSTTTLLETDRARSELETVKHENELLKDRIRALERMLRTRRESAASDASIPLSSSAFILSTPASAVSTSSPFTSTTISAQGRTTQSVPNSAISTSSSAISAGLGGGVNISAWAANSSVMGVAGPRERSESQSTEASARRSMILQDRDRDDGVNVGESAGNSGMR